MILNRKNYLKIYKWNHLNKSFQKLENSSNNKRFNLINDFYKDEKNYFDSKKLDVLKKLTFKKYNFFLFKKLIFLMKKKTKFLILGNRYYFSEFEIKKYKRLLIENYFQFFKKQYFS